MGRRRILARCIMSDGNEVVVGRRGAIAITTGGTPEGAEFARQYAGDRVAEFSVADPHAVAAFFAMFYERYAVDPLGDAGDPKEVVRYMNEVVAAQYCTLLRPAFAQARDTYLRRNNRPTPWARLRVAMHHA